MKPALSGAPDEVAGVRIPRTTLATLAAERARAALPPVLFGHACRVFVFGTLTALREDRSCDAETLYVTAMYANMGLSAAFSRSALRYEVDGADTARSLLRHAGVPAHRVDDVWQAIAFHTTPGIAEHVSALASTLAAAVGTDLIGENFERYTHAEREAILAAYPRERTFKEDVIHAIGRGVAHRPSTTCGTWSADILSRIDPDFCHLNYCGLILGAPWKH